METGVVGDILWSHFYCCCFCQQNFVNQFQVSAKLFVQSFQILLIPCSRFPSFLFVGFGQMIATVAVLFCARVLRIVSFPSLDSSIPRKIMPLPLLFVLNLVSGLGGTKLIK